MESKGSAAACRQELARHLRERSETIARGIVERNRALVEERGEEIGGEPEEVEKVVQAVLEHGFRVIEGREERQPPPEAATHARQLAWKSLRTHVVLRRYDAAAAVFKEHLRQAASSVKPYSEAGYADAERAIERAFDQLKDRVESEHTQEEQRLKSSPEARKLERVKQILSGELIYPPEDLGYDFTATHIGVVGSGPGVDDEIRRLAQVLGGQMLLVQASPDQFWAWIGLKLPSSAARLVDVLKAEGDPAVCIGIGEPAGGLPGWNSTHSQAKAVFRIAAHLPGSAMYYRDFDLIAWTAGDPSIRADLQRTYLEPLRQGRDGNQALRQTLRVYFEAGLNASTASERLGVSRQTVTNHVQRVESLLGFPVRSNRASSLQVALRLEELGFFDLI